MALARVAIAEPWRATATNAAERRESGTALRAVIGISVTVYPSAAINPAGSPGGWLGSLLEGSLLDWDKHQSGRSSPQGGLKPARTETEATRALIRPRLTLPLLEPLHLGRKDDGKFGVAPNVKLRRASRRHLSREVSQANP